MPRNPKQDQDDMLVSLIEVYAKKDCEGKANESAQYMSRCGHVRTCRPCIARIFISEAQSLVVRR